MEFVREYADKVTVLHEGRLWMREICIKFSKSQSDGSVSGREVKDVLKVDNLCACYGKALF